MIKSAGHDRISRDAEVWVFGTGPGPDRLSRRVDAGGPPMTRTDPETYFGKDEVFVVYNAIDTAAGAYLINVARTGIRP